MAKPIDEMESRVQKAWNSPLRFSLSEVGQVMAAELQKFPEINDEDKDVCKAILLVGEAGIGKSRVMEQICTEQGAEFSKHHHGATVAEDNHGNPEIVEHKTVHAVAAHCVPFQRAPNSKSGRGLWLIDESLSGQTKDHENFLRMVIDRKMDEHDIKPGWIICGATNPPTARYTTVRECDGSLEDRFIVVPVEVPADDRLAYWSSRMHPTVYRFLLLNNVKKIDFVTALSSRQWSNLSHTIAHMELAKVSRNVITKLVQSNVGVEIATAFGHFLEVGNNPDKYPVRAKELLKSSDVDFREHLNRIGRWMKANDVALLGATKFDLVVWLEEESNSKAADPAAAKRICEFLVLIGTEGFADMVDDVFSVVRQKPMMKAMLDGIRGTQLEKKLIALLENSKKVRLTQLKEAK